MCGVVRPSDALSQVLQLDLGQDFRVDEGLMLLVVLMMLRGGRGIGGGGSDRHPPRQGGRGFSGRLVRLSPVVVAGGGVDGGGVVGDPEGVAEALIMEELFRHRRPYRSSSDSCSGGGEREGRL